MLRIAALALLLAQSSAVFAFSERIDTRLTVCSRIATDDRRLNCFDGVMQDALPSSDEAVLEPSRRLGTHWRIQRDSSPLDDSRRVVMGTNSLEAVQDRFNREYRPVLMARCQENTTSLIFNFDGIFVASNAGWGLIDMRFDDSAPREVQFEESTDNRALGLWRGAQAIPMLRTLVSHEKLIIRFTGFNDPPRIVEFDVSGARPGIEEIADACNWSL